MKEREHLLHNKTEFLKYFKGKYPLYHDSNIFFRDIHYGVMSYAEERLGSKLKYLEAETLAGELIAGLEKEGILSKVDAKTWLLRYPEFALPRPAPKLAAQSPAPAAQVTT
jgi:hypothetical protein